MDVNQVLEGTLSPDGSIRQNAEQQLLQAAEADFPTYLTTLSQELANEKAQGHIRSAAGLALKNAFSFRDFARLKEVQGKWLNQISDEVKKGLKEQALGTLGTNNSQAGQAAAQFIASIAAIELPHNHWPELMNALVQNVGTGSAQLKQASLASIGFICETQDDNVRQSLAQHSNAILTAVVQGARKEESNEDVRNAAITALSDSLDFVRVNFENEGERNYIMQVVCEATQSTDSRIQQGAFGCLNRIMALYYDKMKFYMEKALFGLTIMGMKNEEEDVAKLAVEFWSTVCEEEISIEDDNIQVGSPSSVFHTSTTEQLQKASAEGSTSLRPNFSFAKVATNEVVPTLLVLLTKQDEDAAEDEYNLARAAYQSLQLYSQAVGFLIIQAVLPFIEENLRHEDWHNRDAAVSAFGAVMEGPEPTHLQSLVQQALPVLIGMMDDKSLHVKDSAAFTLGRICEHVSDAIDPTNNLPPLIAALFEGLSSSPKMATSCCWALMNLSDRFAGEPGCAENYLSPHFEASVGRLLGVTEHAGSENQLRTAAYEVLNSFILNSAQDSLQVVANALDVIIQRLENTIPLQRQVVGSDDKNTLEEMQTSLASVLLNIVQRLDGQIKPQGDRIMQVCLLILGSIGARSSVPDTVFATIGALAAAMEEDFAKYMDSFVPFLYNALGNQDEPALCSMAIGLVSDITRSLNEKAQPYCDTFMNYLLNNLRSTTLSNQFKPAILQCFGDIAGAIGGHFETYLSVVAQVLQQAATVEAESDGMLEMIDYVTSLREGIMDAWQGIILALKSGNKAQLLQPYVDSIFQLIASIWRDPSRSEALLRSSLGVIGDIADSFPNGEFAPAFRHEWVMNFIRDVRASHDFQQSTIDTARWAREHVRRQIGGVTSVSQA
ncbi:MAG: karyopherin beta [Vezdaea aestivalis]|nr:MAG: karyopherin beta [Vezdaea aestivalis]